MLSMTSLVRYLRLITLCSLLLLNSNSLDFCSCIITAISPCAWKSPLLHSSQLEMPTILFIFYFFLFNVYICNHCSTSTLDLTISGYQRTSSNSASVSQISLYQFTSCHLKAEGMQCLLWKLVGKRHMDFFTINYIHFYKILYIYNNWKKSVQRNTIKKTYLFTSIGTLNCVCNENMHKMRLNSLTSRAL